MNIDQGKLNKVTEAMGWLKQAENHYRWLQYEIADDCVKKARSALSDACFDRVPIPGFSRDQTPETIWVKNPINNGKMLINSSDFDPNVHEIWEEPTAPSGKRANK